MSLSCHQTQRKVPLRMLCSIDCLLDELHLSLFVAVTSDSALCPRISSGLQAAESDAPGNGALAPEALRVRRVPHSCAASSRMGGVQCPFSAIPRPFRFDLYSTRIACEVMSEAAPRPVPAREYSQKDDAFRREPTAKCRNTGYFASPGLGLQLHSCDCNHEKRNHLLRALLFFLFCP